MMHSNWIGLLKFMRCPVVVMSNGGASVADVFVDHGLKMYKAAMRGYLEQLQKQALDSSCVGAVSLQLQLIGCREQMHDVGRGEGGGKHEAGTVIDTDGYCVLRAEIDLRQQV